MSGTWTAVGEREVRVGLIGLGTMGRNHLRVLGGLPGVRLVAVSDLDPVALGAASARTGAQPFSEPLAMLSEADLDAVVIAAPTTSHLPLALTAIERGIDHAEQERLPALQPRSEAQHAVEEVAREPPARAIDIAQVPAELSIAVVPCPYEAEPQPEVPSGVEPGDARQG